VHACLTSEEMLDAQCSVPALLLRPLCYPHSALDYRQLVEAAIRLLRARFAWRRMAMRQLLVCLSMAPQPMRCVCNPDARAQVCVTWDGAITDISTANVSDGEVIELTQLLVRASPHAIAAAAVSIIHMSAVCV